MKTRILTGTMLAPILLCSVAAAELDYSWKYYRPGNTGVQGDYSDALWIDPDGLPYICGYDPHFEEGGFANFIEDENRWVNFSNVDYPVIGDPNNTGSSRVSDICPDANGALWMGTWFGALYFDPAIGPDSIVRYDTFNSPFPSGRTRDVSVAPDGSVWFGCSGNGGGLARYLPNTGEWTVWGYDAASDGWPGRILVTAAVVQPKPNGGYLVWVEDTFGNVVFDSDTQQFTSLANNDQPGDIKGILTNDSCDDAGNTWMLRFVTPGQGYSLDYRRPDGTWVTPPQPFSAIYELPAFRAFGDLQAILIGADNDAWHFDGATWTNLGHWRPGGFTYGVDMDSEGNVWVSGNGGAARRDAATGVWQRYRLSNTGQMDNFLRDIAFTDDGDVLITCNGGPGVGGIAKFDGERWQHHNVLTYGLGEDWPFPTDNADAITYRSSTGNLAFNPMFNGIREWDGSNYITLETGSTSDGLVEDSQGRLWTVGNYFSLRYHDDAGFHDVDIAGWGANIERDPDRPGTVWACANLEVVRTDGVYRYSRENADLPELNPMHDVLTTVAAGRDGVAWVGSTEGIFRLDADAGTHEWFHSSNSDLPGDQMTPLVVSPDGMVWFTNFNSNGIEASLVWFDGTNHGTITRQQGLPHAQIYDAEVREVPGGYEVWIACVSRGIAVLTVSTDTPGDLDGDGDVDQADLGILLSCYGVSDCGDLDGDGDTDQADLGLLLANYGG
jgi:streptogramin lyase